jgi:hypothetical protein
MSALALICGRLHGELVTRPTKNGGHTTFFRLRAANRSGLEFSSAATFSDTAREELVGSAEGSPLSAVGEYHRGALGEARPERTQLSAHSRSRPFIEAKAEDGAAEKLPPARPHRTGGPTAEPWVIPIAGRELDRF